MIAKRMKARYELLNSGTPVSNNRRQKDAIKREIKQIGQKYGIKTEMEFEEIPDSLHISSFASQESSFLSMCKYGSMRRVLNATKKPKPVKIDPQQKLEKLLNTKSTKNNQRLL